MRTHAHGRTCTCAHTHTRPCTRTHSALGGGGGPPERSGGVRRCADQESAGVRAVYSPDFGPRSRGSGAGHLALSTGACDSAQWLPEGRGASWSRQLITSAKGAFGAAPRHARRRRKALLHAPRKR
eukprot:5274868-Alexandrium_andersonii.AAC.1